MDCSAHTNREPPHHDQGTAETINNVEDQLEAPDSLASVEESQWRAGVNRQARPDAQEHQVAAARALGEKRKASAMSKEERDARRNEGKRAKRAEAKQRAEVAAAKDKQQRIEAAQAELWRRAKVAELLYELVEDVEERWMTSACPRLEDLNDWLDQEDAVCEEEFDDFIRWLHDEYRRRNLMGPEDYEQDAFVEIVEEWRDSSHYQERALDYEMADWDEEESESVHSDHETTAEDWKYPCYVDVGEPDDPDDPYGGPDLGYEGLDDDEPCDGFAREYGDSCRVRARLRVRRGAVKLALKVVRDREYTAGDGRDWDDYADSAYEYAGMKNHFMPQMLVQEVSSSIRSGTFEEQQPPRRIDYDLGVDGRKAYHDARAVWYRERTGKRLTGTLAQQEELFDNACRYQRARNDAMRVGDAESGGG